MTQADRPIFIVGCPRSGTTLLRLVLCAHSSIAIPHEASFMMDLYHRFVGKDFRKGDVRNEFVAALREDDRFIDSWGRAQEKLDEFLHEHQTRTYAEAVAAVYEAYAIHLKKSVCRWGDKNIGYMLSLPELIDLYPSAQFVHIVRDGRDVAASLYHRRWRLLCYGVPRKAYYIHNPVGAAKLWTSWNCAGMEAEGLCGRDRYFRIRYEDLVRDLEGSCRQLCRFLGEPYQASMLRYYEYNLENNLISAARLAASHENTVKPVSVDRIGRWKKDLPAWYAAVFTSCARDVLKTFGYDCDTRPRALQTTLTEALLTLGYPLCLFLALQRPRLGGLKRRILQAVLRCASSSNTRGGGVDAKDGSTSQI